MRRSTHSRWLAVPQRPHEKTGTGKKRASICPGLEALEDRTLPSTLTVMNGADSGPGSLRATLGAAASGDRIVFAPSVHNVTLTSGELAITQSVNLAGPGARQLTISGSDASRILNVSSGATVNLSGLTLAHGKALQGGAIDNAGTLAISDAVFSDNQAVGGMGGGAIDNEVGASLTLDRNALTRNTATAGDAADVFGGALLNLGTAVVRSSTFSGNQALNGAGPAFAGSQGGAIDNFGGAALTVSASTFLFNTASGAAGLNAATGASNFGVGGAIENNAGFSLGFDGTPGSTATVSGSIFIGNLATGGTIATGNGGAIDNEGVGTSVTLIGSILLGNRAVGGDGGDGEHALSQGLGGGLFNELGTVTIRNSLVLGNQAVGGNHSTPTTDNPLTGAGIGGGIANLFSGVMTISNSAIAVNQALGGRTDAGPGGSALGGGIENSDTFQAPTMLTVNGSAILDNVARAGQGGPGASNVPAGLAAGGGLDDSFFSTAAITNSTLSGNQAIGAPNAAAPGGPAWGGAISVGTNALIGFTDGSSLTLIGSLLTSNQAIGGRGSNGGNGFGGGIAIVSGSSANLQGSTITQNAALGGGHRPGGIDGMGIGGGVYNDGTFTLATTIIRNNHASTSNNDVYP